MASTKDYLDFVLEQLSELKDVTCRAMMGEFILYYRGRIVGGIYDNRLLVKPVKAAVERMPTAPREWPYEGAKEMLLVEEVGRAIGKPGRIVMAVTDEHFAKMILDAGHPNSKAGE